LPSFRGLFGDERADYRASLNRHHEQGPRTDWSQHHVSAYASAHPWEDWAETWAHYMHMVDALDTAASLKIEPRTTSRFGGRRCARCARPTSIAMSLSKLWWSAGCRSRWRSTSQPQHGPQRLLSLRHHARCRDEAQFVHTVIRQATMAPAIGKRMM